MQKNYYIILGIAPDANSDEIKNAYRQLAKKYHPDSSGQNSAPFLEIQEAYAVLSDPTRRSEFNRSAQRERDQTEAKYFEPRRFSASSWAEPLIPERGQAEPIAASLARSFHSFRPSFDSLFNRMTSNFTSSTRPKAERLESLNVVMPLTPIQAFRGGDIRLMIPARLTCPSCSGRRGLGFFRCLQCRGKGEVIGEAPVKISYPAGISDNQVVQLPLDQYGIHNLYLTVRFRVSEII